MPNILVVEDEEAIAELITINLKAYGYECEYRLDGEAGADAIESTEYDLILLDIMLPKVNGYELLEYVKTMNTPVIFITAKSEVKDRIKGLRLGADDYIVKPFDIDEMIARVEAVLRRYGACDDVIDICGLSINMQTKQVSSQGRCIELTPKEFELLIVLVRNKNIILRREDIFEKVWETEYVGDTRTLDLHIQRLRKKLNLKSNIKTVYGSGYMFVDEVRR